MNRFQSALAALLLAGAAGAPLHAALADEPVRPAVGRPLIEAQDLARRHDFAAALAQVQRADDVRDKTANEKLLIAQMRASIAQASGDYKTAIAADEDLLRTGGLSAAQRQNLLMAEAGASYQMHDYAGTEAAIGRYEKAGGRSAGMRQLMIQSAFLAKDYKTAGALQKQAIDETIAAGHTPAETDLQLLANCQLQTGDKAGFNDTMVDLVRYYPKPEYWAQLLHGLRSDPTLPPRLVFDVDRLRLAVGLLTTTDEFMNAAEFGVQAGLPVTALEVMNKGYEAGVLGKGPGATREARLVALIRSTIASRKASLPSELAIARRAPDGNALVQTGYTAVDLGDTREGLDAMKAGIAKGGLVSAPEAEFHLGLAYLMTGDKADAIRTFDGVTGGGPVADLASLWKLEASKPG